MVTGYSLPSHPSTPNPRQGECGGALRQPAQRRTCISSPHWTTTFWLVPCMAKVYGFQLVWLGKMSLIHPPDLPHRGLLSRQAPPEAGGLRHHAGDRSWGGTKDNPHPDLLWLGPEKCEGLQSPLDSPYSLTMRLMNPMRKPESRHLSNRGHLCMLVCGGSHSRGDYNSSWRG